PEFKTPKQLAEWRAELAAKSDSKASTTQDTAFYTGKPYLASISSYEFNYRNYSPELARWTSEDPSGFPDGSNNLTYVNNMATIAVDVAGLNIWAITNPNAAGGGGHTAVIIGDGGRFAYRSYGPNGLDALNFNSLGEAMRYANGAGYADYNRWDTDASQDTAARQSMNNYDYTGSDYQVATHNCQDAVSNALSAAGVNYDHETNVPNQWNTLNRLVSDASGKVNILE
ncbi:MAG: RHS repeat-associated core domain-containing protein, partial [Luteolibacter sp.]